MYDVSHICNYRDPERKFVYKKIDDDDFLKDFSYSRYLVHSLSSYQIRTKAEKIGKIKNLQNLFGLDWSAPKVILLDSETCDKRSFFA